MLLECLDEDAIIVNLGSGPCRLSPSAINLDISSYSNVDVIADICALPFLDNSVDGVINSVVLEHVPTPITAVNEMRRILKPGGRVFCVVPFMQGYHASPHDYTRWTKAGVEKLFGDFEMVEIGIAAGPTSSFVWILQEWLATLFSFNIPFLYRFLFFFFMVLTCPLKWLDLVLNRYKSAANIAATFYFFGRKV